MSSSSSLSPCRKKSTIYNLLTLRKSLYLDDLRTSVPYPGGDNNIGEPWPDLPRWHQLPLEKKMPALPGLEAILSRRKLGRSLRVDVVNKKRFDTSDPWGYEAKLPYEGMHDPHLTKFFRDNAQVRDLIVKAGLVTSQLDVKCSLMEYNAYRNYLRIMHGKAIRKELEKQDVMHREKMLLEITEKQAQKKIEELKKYEIRANLVHELNLQHQKRLQDLRDKWQRNNKRIRGLKQTQRQALQQKKDEMELKDEIFRQKRAMMAKREQQRILNTLKKWNERDYALERTLEMNAMKRREKRIAAILNKFEKKKECQEKWMQREAVIRECAERFKKSFIKCYQQKIEESQRKLHELFLAKRKALEKPRKVKKTTKRKSSCRCPVN